MDRQATTVAVGIALLTYLLLSGRLNPAPALVDAPATTTPATPTPATPTPATSTPATSIELPAIPSLHDFGYNIQLEPPEDDTPPNQQWYAITHPTFCDSDNVPQLLNTFGISSDQVDAGRIWVSHAYNSYDNRPKSSPGSAASHDSKLPLRALILGFWAQVAGREPRALTQIYYETMVEKNLTSITPKVFQMLGCPMASTVIQCDDKGSTEAFALLGKEAPFCAGALKMVADYVELVGVRVKSFEYIFWDRDLYDTGGRNLRANFAVNLEVVFDDVVKE